MRYIVYKSPVKHIEVANDQLQIITVRGDNAIFTIRLKSQSYKSQILEPLELSEFKQWLSREQSKWQILEKEVSQLNKPGSAAIARAYLNAYSSVMDKLEEVDGGINVT